MTRTDHSNTIRDLRKIADDLDPIVESLKSDEAAHLQHDLKQDTVVARAAADLLEMHDRTSLNLYEAPNLLALVQSTSGTIIPPFRVEPKHA